MAELPTTEASKPTGSWGRSFTQTIAENEKLAIEAARQQQREHEQQQREQQQQQQQQSQAAASHAHSNGSAQHSHEHATTSHMNGTHDAEGVDSTSHAGATRGGAARGGRRGARGGRAAQSTRTTNGTHEEATTEGDADQQPPAEPQLDENGQPIPERKPKKKYDTPYQPVPKTDKPDESAYKKQKAETEAQIEALKKKIDTMTAKVDELSKERNTAREGRRPLFDQLKEVKQQKQQFFEEAKKYDAMIQQVKTQDKMQQQKLREMKKELEFTDVNELDAYIKHVENVMSTTSVPATQERALIEKIRKLKKQRDTVQAYSTEQQQYAAANKTDTSEWEKEKKRLNAEGGKLKDQETELSKQLDEYGSTATGANDTVESLVNQRRAAVEQKNQLIDASKQLDRDFKQQQYLHERWVKQEAYEEKKREREELRAKEKAEYEARKAKREEIAERKARQAAEREEYKKQREEQEREWREQQEAAEASRDVWEEEKWIADEIISYLNKLSGNTAKSSTESAADSELQKEKARLAAERSSKFKAETGKPLVPMKAKKEDLFNTGSLKAKKAPKPAAAASTDAAKPATSTKKAVPTVLSHRPETMQWFNKIDIDPPHTIAAVPSVLEKVKEKRQWYETAPRELKTGRKGKKQPAATSSDSSATSQPEESDDVSETADKLDSTTIANDQDGPQHQHASNSADTGAAGDINASEESEIIHRMVDAHNSGAKDLSAIADDGPSTVDAQ